MRTLPAVIAAIATGLFVSSASAPAAILIDGFLDDTIEVVAPGSPSSVITNDIDASNIDRQISVTANGDMSIVSTVLDGFFVADADNTGTGSANVEVEYLGFLIDLSDNLFLQFDAGKVEGTPVLGVILDDASFGQISGGVTLAPTATGQSYFLDITQFSGYTPGFGSQLNSILILIGDGDSSFFVEGDSIQFTSVPEPSTGLLFAAGLAGLARRRRSR